MVVGYAILKQAGLSDRSNMRNCVTAPKRNITQGTIFSGVRSPYDVGSVCYGICITARCDTARDFKAPALTFLSVVTMDSWLWVEMLQKAILDQRKAALGALKKYLVEKKGTSIILDAFGPDKGFLEAEPADKGMKKQSELYKEASLAEKLSPFEWKKIPKSIAKRITTEANQLLLGKMQDFYFIEDVEGVRGGAQVSQNLGFVVLLRDIRTISRDLALLVADGIDSQQFDNLKNNDQTIHQLALNEDGFLCPVGELKSPFIEQLLQNFSILFGRVGTKEVPSLYSERIQTLLGSQD